VATSWSKSSTERRESGFAALSKFRAREGHCCPPRRHVEGNFQLGNWVSVQRYCKEFVPTERKRRLDAIGLVWDWRDYFWEQNFAALLKFKRREGRLSCTEATPRRTLQTWIMGFGAAQRKERDAAQTAITRNPGRRLCSTGVQANRPADLW